MSKTRILLLSIHYPLAMKSYFEKAFRHREDVELKTAGPYTGQWIPWKGGMNLPAKYAVPPDIPLPFPPNVGLVSYDLVKSQLNGWKPDIVLAIDAGINWASKPSDGFVATIGTDPHVLNYSHARSVSDKFFSMQLCYSEKGDVYLPYAYSKYDYYPDDSIQKDLNVVLIGMRYEHREILFEELGARGVGIHMENGPVFDEAREIYNRGKIGLNWSSLNDLNCRAFELPAMRLCPVMNRVPDADKFFTEDVHYLAFSNVNEAIEKIVWAKENPIAAKEIATAAHHNVLPHTYDARVQTFLEECGF